MTLILAGGGSASLAATYAVKPLEGIKQVAEDMGATVQYEQGVETSRWTPLLTEYLRMPEGKQVGSSRAYIEFFDVK